MKKSILLLTCVFFTGATFRISAMQQQNQKPFDAVIFNFATTGAPEKIINYIISLGNLLQTYPMPKLDTTTKDELLANHIKNILEKCDAYKPLLKTLNESDFDEATLKFTEAIWQFKIFVNSLSHSEQCVINQKAAKITTTLQNECAEQEFFGPNFQEFVEPNFIDQDLIEPEFMSQDLVLEKYEKPLKKKSGCRFYCTSLGCILTTTLALVTGRIFWVMK